MGEQEWAIQTFGLSKTYGQRIAVNGVDISVKKGELFSLLGPNGAGKTTTIKMLSCLIRPTEGSALVLGHDIVKDPFAVKDVIDVSPQENAIAGHLNAWENLELMGRVYGLSKEVIKKRAGELLELMGLSERLNDQAHTFSGGMQRRLSIAMALISDPQVLFLDEPTLGLDPQARRTMWERIAQLKGEKTIILTSHYLEEVDALADRVAIINDGNIVAVDTTAGLKRQIEGKQTMIVKGQLSSKCVDAVKKIYEDTKTTDGGIEIRADKLVFDDIVDTIRKAGGCIEWLTMKEPTLDDVFLKLTGEEVSK